MQKCILIVDECLSSRLALREILTGEYDVFEAANGVEALRLLSERDAAIAAVTLRASDATGFEIIARITAESKSTPPPVLAILDLSDAGTEEAALMLGASDFIFVPYTASAIRNRLANIIAATSGIKKLRAEKETLREREEQFRIAATIGDRIVARYDINTRTYYTTENTHFAVGSGKIIENAPQAFVDMGIIAPESERDFIEFFESMVAGASSASADLSFKVGSGEFRWYHCEATVIPDNEGRPSQAIVVSSDITQQREKELVYERWRQSLEQKKPESYVLYRGNLSKDNAFSVVGGKLLHFMLPEKETSFDAITLAYATQCVHPDDRSDYLSQVSADKLIANFYRDKRFETLDYREALSDGSVRWLRLTIELMNYPNSRDVQAHLMFEDIDESKSAEMKAIEMAENDPLTGVLNRTAFTRKLEQLIAGAKTSQHTLILLDIDGFKLLNDVFGHAAGDEALIDIANTLRALLRHGDLLGRLGGDEFFIFMQDIPYEAVIEKKVMQICAQVRKAFSHEVQISASVGIAVYPRDGEDFDSLYRSADAALYAVKESGKNGFAFYNRDISGKLAGKMAVSSSTPLRVSSSVSKRRILIVDDNEINLLMLSKIFEKDYHIETARDGKAALIRMRHFGTGLSVVLLDLVMPGMDGFAVMEKMRESVEMQAIPVIVVSGHSERDITLKAIKYGATDYVTKPVDPDLIRLRVESAISKAENERLRAQNGYLLLQSGEEAKYRTVLDSTGTVVIEYDWINSVFYYDASITERIAGRFDNRILWRVFLSDMVADALDVKAMQELVHDIAGDRGREDGSLIVKLKTPSGERQWFRMRVFKRMNEYQLADKIIITYINVHEEVLADEKLRFQAERDALTGLYNRTTFLEKCAEVIAKSKPGSYVMTCFDINNFKVINDQYGSEKGDSVLIQVADIFRNGFEPSGGITSRITADNFAVLYPIEFLYSEKLVKIREDAALLDGTLPPISFSIGRYVVDDKTLSPSAMCDRAALAKTSIKGRYDTNIAEYDESMRDKLIHEQEIVNEMNPALEGYQFVVWFQPQYNHSTGALIGAEALVRWKHPLKGVVSPGEFVPVFERNGFIYELDKYVWRETCQLLRKWIDEGRSPLPVSVNISRYDVFREDLIDFISGLVRRYDIPLDLLRLEITESAFAKSTEQIITVVKKLIDFGFTVEIDDFGSGYSSLNTLKDVPAQVLKLDMRFLENDESSDRGGNVLESVVRMAKWLGMAVIAEGVETIEQADYLKSIGCVYIQGYLYSKPIPAQDYEALMQSAGKEEKLLALETVKNLDNNAFWDPKSMDTLIFNSYVGAACIAEYHAGHVELVRMSEKFTRVLGSTTMTDEDAFKLDWINAFDADSRLRFLRGIYTAIETRDEVTGEYVFLNMPGCPAFTHMRITLRVIASAGDHYLVYCMNENITVQREAERKERDAIERLQAIMDNVNGGISAVRFIDGMPEFLFANDQYYKLAGYTKAQFEAEVNTPFDLVLPEDRERVIRETRNASVDKEPLVTRFRSRRRDGSVIWKQSSVSITRLPGIDEPVQLTVTTDVTSQVETEQNEKRVSEQLSLIMQSLSCGVSGVTIEGDSVKYVFANDMYYSMLGYTKEQFEAEIGNGLDLIHPEDRPRVNAEISKLTSVGDAATLEYRVIRRDGEVRYLRVQASMIILDGVDKLVNLGVSNDVTDIERARQQLVTVSEQMQAVLDNISSGITATTVIRGKLSYLFENDRYFELLGYTRAQYAAEVSDTFELIHPADRQLIRDAVYNVNVIGKNVALECRVVCRDGTEKWAKISISTRKLKGIERPVQFAVYTDITEEKLAEYKINEATAQLKFLNDTASELLSQTDADKGVNGVLRRVLSYFGGDRAYVIEYDSSSRVSVNTYEVCAEGVTSEIENLKSIPYEAAKYWLKAFEEHGYISISDIDQLNESRASERALLEQQSISSLVAVPLMRDGAIIGFTGVDNPSCNETHISHLRAIGDYLATMLVKRDLYARIEGDRRTLMAMMNDTPGSFTRLRVNDNGTLSIDFVNDTFCYMRGMSREEIMREDSVNAMVAVHPDDLDIVKAVVMDIIKTRGTRHVKYRIKHKSGDYIPLSAFARLTIDEDGTRYINVYYADMTEQEKRELTIRETMPFVLSAILASSGDIAFAKDKDFKYICVSAPFVRFTQYTDPQQIIGKTDYELFSKDIADVFRSMDTRLITQDKPQVDFIDIVPSREGELRYMRMSKYVIRDTQGNLLGLYGTGRDISEERDAYSRLKLLTNSIPGGIATYVHSPAGIKITYFNDSFCAMMGYTREEYERVSATGITNITFKEDVPLIMAQVDELLRNDTQVNCTYRVHTKQGGYIWVNLIGGIAERHGNVCVINAVLYDVTERVEALNKLRMSEEQFRIAASLGGKTVVRYDIKTGVYSHQDPVLIGLGFPERIENVPQAFVDAGIIAKESEREYFEFYNKIMRGERIIKTDTAIIINDFTNRWLRGEAVVIFDSQGEPSQAIIVFSDITEQREKETVFEKWQQSLKHKPEHTYTLFRCNLSKNASFDFRQGTLIWADFEKPGAGYNDRTSEYVNQCVHADDRDEYLKFMNSDTLLANFYRGVRAKTLTYRESMPDGNVRNLRLTVQLVEYPDTSDVESFLLFELVDGQKRGEPGIRPLAEADGGINNI